MYYNLTVNKIVPVLCLIFSLVSAVASTLGLITMSIAVSVSELAVISVPTAIIGAVFSALSVAAAFLFRRDKLCRIALFVSIGALAVSFAAIVIWLCM